MTFRRVRAGGPCQKIIPANTIDSSSDTVIHGRGIANDEILVLHLTQRQAMHISFGIVPEFREVISRRVAINFGAASVFLFRALAKDAPVSVLLFFVFVPLIETKPVPLSADDFYERSRCVTNGVDVYLYLDHFDKLSKVVNAAGDPTHGLLCRVVRRVHLQRDAQVRIQSRQFFHIIGLMEHHNRQWLDEARVSLLL